MNIRGLLAPDIRLQALHINFLAFGGKSGSGKYIHSCNPLRVFDSLHGYSGKNKDRVTLSVLIDRNYFRHERCKYLTTYAEPSWGSHDERVLDRYQSYSKDLEEGPNFRYDFPLQGEEQQKPHAIKNRIEIQSGSNERHDSYQADFHAKLIETVVEEELQALWHALVRIFSGDRRKHDLRSVQRFAVYFPMETLSNSDDFPKSGDHQDPYITFQQLCQLSRLCFLYSKPFCNVVHCVIAAVLSLIFRRESLQTASDKI